MISCNRHSASTNHDSIEYPREFIDAEWLGDHAGKPVITVICHHRVVGVSTEHNHLGFIVELQNPFDRILSSESARNGEVHDDNVKIL